ncbi:MAG: cell division protein FtsQ/DivIB [Solirubrobacterales bacterium]
MERSLAGRSPIRTQDLLWRPLQAAGGLARSSFQAILRHRRLRIAFLAALITLPLLTGGWLLLRNSSFVAVEHVRVSGVRGPEAQAIKTALAGTARHMSTLDVHPGALRAAVASFPVVRSVRAIPSFPHSLRIEVVEQLPVAALSVGGTRTAVAADGVVLGPALLSSSLPAVTGYHDALVGARVQGPNVLAAVAVLGAAPTPLRRVLTRVYNGPEGLTVAFRSGLLAYFGDAARPHAKWFSLARVLADPSSTGASYIDVRLPERPAAGFPSGSGPASGTTSTTGQASTPESTIASLAAGLRANTPSGPAAGAGATPAESAPAGGASSPAPTEAATTPGAAESTPANGSEETSGATPAPGG